MLTKNLKPLQYVTFRERKALEIENEKEFDIKLPTIINNPDCDSVNISFRDRKKQQEKTSVNNKGVLADKVYVNETTITANR